MVAVVFKDNRIESTSVGKIKTNSHDTIKDVLSNLAFPGSRLPSDVALYINGYRIGNKDTDLEVYSSDVITLEHPIPQEKQNIYYPKNDFVNKSRGCQICRVCDYHCKKR